MRRHFVADSIQENGAATIVARVEIDEKQHQEIHSWFDFAPYYHTCRSIARMVQESGQDFINFCDSLASEQGGHDDLEIDDLLITGNKLLISYLSFIRTFVDVISKAIADKKQDALAVFQDFNHIMYDSFLGYRLLTRMRNYVLHYDMPLTVVTDSVKNGVVFACSKDSLLAYNGWSSLKNEIATLPQQFSILPMVSECQVAVDTLFLKALEFVADDVLSGNDKMNSFCIKHNIHSPIILILDDSSDSPPEINKLPLHMVKEYAKDLSRHPNYTISIIEK